MHAHVHLLGTAQLLCVCVTATSGAGDCGCRAAGKGVHDAVVELLARAHVLRYSTDSWRLARPLVGKTDGAWRTWRRVLTNIGGIVVTLYRHVSLRVRNVCVGGWSGWRCVIMQIKGMGK